jgi:hypothetical protein
MHEVVPVVAVPATMIERETRETRQTTWQVRYEPRRMNEWLCGTPLPTLDWVDTSKSLPPDEPPAHRKTLELKQLRGTEETEAQIRAEGASLRRCFEQTGDSGPIVAYLATKPNGGIAVLRIGNAGGAIEACVASRLARIELARNTPVNVEVAIVILAKD